MSIQSKAVRLIAAGLLSSIVAGCGGLTTGDAEPEVIVSVIDGGDASVDDSGGGGAEGQEASDEAAFDHLAALPVSDGLSVALFAGNGVEVGERQQVVGWTDLVSGNLLEPVTEAPTLVASGRNGHDLVRFDDAATILEARNPSNLPVGNQDRTVILAGDWGAEWKGDIFAGFRGFGWGDPVTYDSVFFTGNVNYNCFSDNLPGIQTGLGNGGSVCWGQTTNEFVMADSGLRGNGFLSMASVVDSGELRLYFRDRLEASSSQTFASLDDRLWIGGWPGGEIVEPFDVVTALVYDRALSEDELTMVVDHLRETYGVDG